MPDDPDPILLTGATGYVGSHLLTALLERGRSVRAMTRNPDRANFPQGVDAVKADAVSGEGLDDALAGCATAFYLIHAMGKDGGDFADRDKQSAKNFGEAAKRAGVRRVVYLGGLAGTSEHLRSREETAKVLAQHGPQTVHARAAMVIGDGSASFEIVRHLVRRLPAMIAPRWIDTRTQPIALADAVNALIECADADDPPPEVELGGADVLTYREMMARYARLAGQRPRPILKVPVLTPRLSSYWVALVTPVELGLIQPLVAGLGEELIVRHHPPAGINDDPMGFDDAVRAAL